MNSKSYHQPVLPQESIQYLNIKRDGDYLDCTLGEGGHSRLILKQLSKEGSLTSIDHDLETIEFVQNEFGPLLESTNWKLMRSNFNKIHTLFEKDSFDGILMDLGISSRHIDIPGRGFSYKADNDPLDMRMDNELGVKASDLLLVFNEDELAKLFFTYGEEKHSKRIARSIKSSDSQIESVNDLKQAINRALPAASSDRTFARIFQALRITVNDEIGSLKAGLVNSIPLLRPNGRLVVISFHSLEDRAVKQFFRDQESLKKIKILTKKPVTPGEDEISGNSRSRSAKLRACQKL